jgi:hypothetical protein
VKLIVSRVPFGLDLSVEVNGEIYLACISNFHLSREWLGGPGHTFKFSDGVELSVSRG